LWEVLQAIGIAPVIRFFNEPFLDVVGTFDGMSMTLRADTPIHHRRIPFKKPLREDLRARIIIFTLFTRAFIKCFKIKILISSIYCLLCLI